MRLEEPQWYECAKYWPAIEPWVAKALSHGGLIFAPADILHALLMKRMKLWLAFDGDELKGCCVAEIEQFERARVCCVLVIGGEEAQGWLHFSKAVEDWGRAMGCDYAQGVGREGWKRVAKPFGYEPVAVIYRKAL